MEKEKCKSCAHFHECRETFKKINVNSNTCPDFKIQHCYECVMFEGCKEEKQVEEYTGACEFFQKSPGTKPVVENYINNIVLPVLKAGHTEDFDKIEKIEYVIKYLGTLIQKTPEEIHLERILIDIFFEDFDTDYKISKAKTAINNIIEHEGIDLPLDTKLIDSITGKLTEIKLIYKLSLALGLVSFADNIVNTLIEARFGKKETHIHPNIKKT